MKIKIIKGSNFEFKNKKILIMGLGLNGGGVGVTKFLYNQKARITVTDLKDQFHLRESLKKLKDFSNINYVLGKHDERDFQNNDIIIKGAGIKWDNKFIKIAINSNNYVDSAAGVFFELSKNYKIGITGSKGKSTTTTLVYEILKKFNKNVKIAGNISKSFFEEFNRNEFSSLYVLELSSWQLYDISLHKKSPEIAIITTLMPDHLNYYNTMENYINDKKYIYKYQNRNNYLILNIDNNYIVNNILKDSINSNLIFITNLNSDLFNLNKKFIKNFAKQLEFIIGFNGNSFYIIFYKNKLEKIVSVTGLEKLIKISKTKIFKNIDNLTKLNLTNLEKNNYEIYEIEDLYLYKLFKIDSLFILGLHNYYNISLAIAATLLKKIPLNIIKNTIENFRGVKYRNEYIGSINEIKFYNDTTATIPDAVAATIASFNKKIVLIAGGVDKKLSLTNMVNAIINNVKHLILFNGDGSDKLLKLLKENGFENIEYFYDNIFDAVKKAYETSQKGDIVVLSPGFASFNMFRNEFERGDLFNQAFKNLKNQIFN